jgi:hypothetical protein
MAYKVTSSNRITHYKNQVPGHVLNWNKINRISYKSCMSLYMSLTGLIKYWQCS